MSVYFPFIIDLITARLNHSKLFRFDLDNNYDKRTLHVVLRNQSTVKSTLVTNDIIGNRLKVIYIYVYCNIS